MDSELGSPLASLLNISQIPITPHSKLQVAILDKFPDFPIFSAHKCLIIEPIPILVGELRHSGATCPAAGSIKR
jgi:hypothetical protein